MIGTLNVKTQYSMLDSTVNLEQYFEYAKKYGYTFITMADNNLHALYKFLLLSKKNNIKPIVGHELIINFRDIDLVFLVYARNDDELKAIIKLSTESQKAEKLDFANIINELNNLLVCLPTNQKSILSLLENQDALVDLILNLNKKIKTFTLGLSYQDDKYFELNKIIKSTAYKGKIKLLPSRKVNYLSIEDRKTYNVLRKIKNQLVEDNTEDLSFLNEQALKLEYQDALEVFDNLNYYFEQTKYNYLESKFELPVYPTKDKVEAKQYLEALAKMGLKKRLEKVNKPDILIYQHRLDHELEVINQMGYNDYFLIVYDFVRYAKSNDILVGPGRGSAAGSLIAFCLGITEVDPIYYDLLFERFLNKDRKSMPDIDMDFPDNKRDQVIEYVKNKYGNNHVVTLSTFTTFAEKSSIRDIARILKLDNARTTAIIKANEKNKLDETDIEANELIKVAKKLEGLPRQTGTHAAGVILSKEDLSVYVPLQKGPHDMLQSQLEASDVEALGFLKIDFLGLRNLSIIDDIFKLEKIDYKLSDIPLDDLKTYELLKRVETTGIFQLESNGMKNVIKKLQPEKFEDIVALLALFRPGPMQFIDEYISARHGADFPLVDPSIDDVLKPTYGIIVYQEQIMKIAQQFAGYSLSQADLLRRGIAKKDKDILEKEKSNFINKAIEQNKDKNVAIKIYNYIEKFADYGFNRSHSVAYALLAYQMAYLKTHYFQTFMAVLMSSATSNIEAIEAYTNEVRSKNYDVLKPDIRYSTTKFIKTKYSLLAPLLLIKGIGLNTVEKIIEERSLGEFKDYNDFKIRMKGIINEKNLISLIHAGALDSFNLTHATMLNAANLGQTGFENFLDDYKELELAELDFEILKQNEIEVLGFNLYYRDDPKLKKLKEKLNLKEFSLNDPNIKLIATVIKVKEFVTKTNKVMAFVDLNVGNNQISATIFDKEYINYRNLLKEKYLIFYLSKNDKGYTINRIEKV